MLKIKIFQDLKKLFWMMNLFWLSASYFSVAVFFFLFLIEFESTIVNIQNFIYDWLVEKFNVMIIRYFLFFFFFAISNFIFQSFDIKNPNKRSSIQKLFSSYILQLLKSLVEINFYKSVFSPFFFILIKNKIKYYLWINIFLLELFVYTFRIFSFKAFLFFFLKKFV